MSKKSNNTTSPAAETAPSAPVVEAITEATAATVEETAESETAVSAVPPGAPPPIVAAPAATLAGPRDYPEELDTSLAFDPQGPHAKAVLLRMFPGAARQIRGYRPVAETELTQLTLDLPEKLSANLTEALERMSPDHVGLHVVRATEIKLFDLRVFHGTGDDPARPKATPPGGIYSTDNRLHAVCDGDLAVTYKMPETLRAYVIAYIEGRTLWPPRDDNNNPEGGAKSRAPLCTSMDREKGDQFGLCDACPHRPFQGEHERGDCTNEVTLFVVPEDFSGIYRWSLSKTGLEMGKAIRKATSAGWRSLWERPFVFNTRKEVSKDNPSTRWYVPVATPVGTPTPSEISDALRVLARKIDTEIYWPARRLVHVRAATPSLRRGAGTSGTAAAEPAKKTDGSALAALAGVGAGKALPDLSGGAGRSSGGKNV